MPDYEVHLFKRCVCVFVSARVRAGLPCCSRRGYSAKVDAFCSDDRASLSLSEIDGREWAILNSRISVVRWGPNCSLSRPTPHSNSEGQELMNPASDL